MSFFESTPIGRIQNRFTKDLTAVEFQLPCSFKDVTYCVLDALANIIMISYATPLFLIVIIPLTIIYSIILRFYVTSYSKFKRLDSASRSPIFSHFGETLTGISSIRAYKCQERFIKNIEQKVDDNNRFFYPSIVCKMYL